PTRQRVSEGTPCTRKRPAWVKLQPIAIDGDGEAIGVVLIAGLQRLDAAEMKVIRQHSAGGELLRAFDDDAVVALLDHAGIERRVALRMRRLGAVDLRRHDRVSAIDVAVAHELVEGDEIVGELLAGCGKELRRRGIADKEAGDMIGRAAHQTEGRLRPSFRKQPSRPQIGMTVWNLPGPMHRLAGFWRDERHALAQFRGRGDVIEVRDRACRAAKGRMGGDVFDPLAVDEYPPSILERAKIFGTRSHRQFSPARPYSEIRSG